MMILFMFILFVLAGAVPLFYVLGTRESYIGGFWQDLTGKWDD